MEGGETMSLPNILMAIWFLLCGERNFRAPSRRRW